MIETLADQCTAIAVLVDDLSQIVATPADHRPGPRSDFSDSEVITLTVVAELLGLDEEKRFLKDVRRHHRALFPALPERSRFNRRRRCLTEVTNRIRAALQQAAGRLLPPEERALGVLDSLPVPVVGFHHARDAHRWWGEAAYGVVASKKQTIDGFKLHLLISSSGLILDFALASAQHRDGAFIEQLLADNANWTTRATSMLQWRPCWPGAPTCACSPPNARTNTSNSPPPSRQRSTSSARSSRRSTASWWTSSTCSATGPRAWAACAPA